MSNRTIQHHSLYKSQCSIRSKMWPLPSNLYWCHHQSFSHKSTWALRQHQTQRNWEIRPSWAFRETPWRSCWQSHCHFSNTGYGEEWVAPMDSGSILDTTVKTIPQQERWKHGDRLPRITLVTTPLIFLTKTQFITNININKLIFSLFSPIPTIAKIHLIYH